MCAQRRSYTQTTVEFTLLCNPSLPGWMFGHKYHTGGTYHQKQALHYVMQFGAIQFCTAANIIIHIHSI